MMDHDGVVDSFHERVARMLFGHRHGHITGLEEPRLGNEELPGRLHCEAFVGHGKSVVLPERGSLGAFGRRNDNTCLGRQSRRIGGPLAGRQPYP